MSDPILTLRIDTSPQYINLDFPDALNDQVTALVDDSGLAYNLLFTGTAGDDTGSDLLDTGNLSAGVYAGRCVVSSSTAAIDFDFQHRNAADAANIASVRFDQLANVYVTVFAFRLRVLLNESIVIALQNDIANGATVQTQIVMDRVAL